MRRCSRRRVVWCLIAAMLILALFGFRWDRQCQSNGNVIAATDRSGESAAEGN
jgi:hypothetical protein